MPRFAFERQHGPVDCRAMNEIQRYLAEEVAVDLNDGVISRREALHRLRVMGLGVTAIAALLAGCGGDSEEPADQSASQPNQPGAGGTTPTPTSSATDATPTATTEPTNPSQLMPGAPAGTTPAATSEPTSEPTQEPPPQTTPSVVPTQEIMFTGPRGPLLAAFAPAATPRGAVLVIHENRGLNDHIRSVAGRLAGAGYSALALDLLSEEGGTASLGDPANATAALNAAAPSGRFVPDMQAALDELARRAPGSKLAVIGFCFGGGMSWSLLAAGEARLAAAAPFYGPLPSGANLGGSQAAVVAFYGSLDTRVNATRDAADQALTQAGLVHEMVTYEGANHAFFNDTGARYDANAAAQAWAKLLEWFGEHLAP
jgi:carboxymethylenebutenolidase